MNEDVKPEACPWCRKSESLEVNFTDDGNFAIRCMRCCCDGPSVDHDGNSNLTEDDAWAAWNRRTPVPLPDAVCDRLIAYKPLYDRWEAIIPTRVDSIIVAKIERFGSLALARAAVRLALAGNDEGVSK